MADAPEVDLTNPESPAAKGRRWQMEISAAKRKREKWHDRAKKAIQRYLDEKDSEGPRQSKRLNLFYSDTELKKAVLYGKVPKITATRRFSDQNDALGRVGAEMLDRLINTDIEKGSDTCASAVYNALEDWILPGLGQAMLRYWAKFEQVPETPAVTRPDPMTGMPVEVAPAVPAHEKKTDEGVNVDYVPWRRFLWSPCETWDEVRWAAVCIPMSRAQLVEEFGKELGNAIKLDAKAKEQSEEEANSDPAGRANVWEIWSKDDRKIYRFSECYPTILDEKDDPYGLDDFFPFPAPLTANTTTSSFMPVPDYHIAAALYAGCDELFRKICLLEEAVGVRGVYDATVPALEELLEPSNENALIPVPNFSAFLEKGGLKGAVDFMPLDQVVGALNVLYQKLQEKIQFTAQITGMADIMRGASAQSATATEQAIKAKFGSIRGQSKQDKFAAFVTNLLRIKGEMISKLFDPETIIQKSNIAAGFQQDAQLALQAAQLIKDDHSAFRIEVRSEQLSMQDMAQLKQERTEAIQSLGGLIQATMPLLNMPGGADFVLQVGSWMLAALKGGSEIEGAFDQFRAQVTQAMMAPKPPPPPDPRIQAQQVKSQADIQKTQADLQADLIRTKAETQAEVQRQAAQAHFNVQEERAKAMAAALNPMNGMP